MLLQRMKRSVVALLVGIVTIGTVAIAAPATAQATQAAPADPHTYSLYCHSVGGSYFYVTTPSQCSWGVIQFISDYDGTVAGKLDMYWLQSHMKSNGASLTQLYNQCTSQIICGIFVAAVQTVILSKVKIAYIWFKGIIG